MINLNRNSFYLDKADKNNIYNDIYSSQSIILSAKLVFSKWPYILLAGCVTTSFWRCSTTIYSFDYNGISCGCRNKHESVSDKTVKGIEDGYAIIIFRVRMSVLSSTCTSCSLLEFLLVSTFGGLGVTASTFLTNYQMSLRAAILPLIWAFHSIGILP